MFSMSKTQFHRMVSGHRTGNIASACAISAGHHCRYRLRSIGAVVSKAQVILKNLGTNEERPVSTDERASTRSLHCSRHLSSDPPRPPDSKPRSSAISSFR